VPRYLAQADVGSHEINQTNFGSVHDKRLHRGRPPHASPRCGCCSCDCLYIAHRHPPCYCRTESEQNSSCRRGWPLAIVMFQFFCRIIVAVIRSLKVCRKPSILVLCSSYQTSVSHTAQLPPPPPSNVYQRLEPNILHIPPLFSRRFCRACSVDCVVTTYQEGSFCKSQMRVPSKCPRISG